MKGPVEGLGVWFASVAGTGTGDGGQGQLHALRLEVICSVWCWAWWLVVLVSWSPPLWPAQDVLGPIPPVF